MAKRFITKLGLCSLFLAAMMPTSALAHCDGIDGPVVAAARRALETGEPGPALVWVQPSDEPAIRAAFAETLTVRRLSPRARDMADRYFFETLVRLHRAGEGAPYTGLQPAGRDLGPAIPLADRAVESGSQTELLNYLNGELGTNLRERFEDLQRKRQASANDVEAGRRYVASYVSFIHYVEAVHRTATANAEGHYAEAGNPHPSPH